MRQVEREGECTTPLEVPVPRKMRSVAPVVICVLLLPGILNVVKEEVKGKCEGKKVEEGK